MDHKSYYNKEDMDILNEHRTTANVGYMKNLKTTPGLVELDVYQGFTQIRRVPVSNEFDVWRPYAGQPMGPLSLYKVEGGAGSPLFFNKTTNLVYGQFLKDFPDARILAVKKPSFIRKARYASSGSSTRPS